MNPEVKKKVMIGAIVACLAAATAITLITQNRSPIAPGPSGSFFQYSISLKVTLHSFF